MTRESWSWKNPAVPDSFQEEQARKLAEAEAEAEAFHLKPTGLLDRLMERFRVIATDPDKCPEGTISWKQNRNHVGQALRKEANQRSFNEALALLAETEGRLISGDPVIWQR